MIEALMVYVSSIVDGDAIRVDKADLRPREHQKISPSLQLTLRKPLRTFKVTHDEINCTTYLSSAVLRGAFRLRELSLPAFSAITIVAAVSPSTAAHHV